MAPDVEMPAPSRRDATPNPFTGLVTKAAKDGKRYDLPGRFSLTPYEGRKGACEAFTVVGKLHAAGRSAGVKLNVRRFDTNGQGCRITFKVVK
ncbi:hypothetical protein [Blastococcus sp. VKM Ac-2987]|uniref:hypothetical protein n=1 Tax=Blastococcus sp. VKM Ac-2987 TaxID=3004141 RepID=UPI0022ABA79A|nr:hypothetical protein [Blastococcus sp. VKM Ac-2987]MCZ2857820.1 hypothetical protein [Blastococcus sp. VKM Ac-2987]